MIPTAQPIVFLVPTSTMEKHGTTLARMATEADADLRFVTLADESVDQANALYLGPDSIPDEILPLLQKSFELGPLEWTHLGWAGVDKPFIRLIHDKSGLMTTSSGCSSEGVSTLAISLTLAIIRQLHLARDAQLGRSWQVFDLNPDLEDLRVLVMGMGPIGNEIARKSLALAPRTKAIRRTPSGQEPCPTFPSERLDELLAETDVLIVAAPLTDATRGLLDARRLALMPRGSYLVNVGRAQIVDERAMIAALESGQLAAAGLDVYDPEPLPTDSPLWGVENLLLNPHTAARTRGTNRRADEIFVENLRRWLHGEPLRNVVDPAMLGPAFPTEGKL